MAEQQPPTPQGDLFDPPGLIDSPDALAALLPRLQAAEWLAIDTEFMRERTYYARLCLVQLATPDEQAWCIDPLALDLEPLRPLLTDPTTTKVFHSATQDLEILTRHFASAIGPVFDTQLAATTLGLGDQIGYARLVQARLDVELAKGHTRADWSRRPLGPELIEYALEDVRYLARLYPALCAEVEQRGLSGSLAADHRRLGDPATHHPDPARAWERIRVNGPLDDTERAVLMRLAAWREEQARARDRPRGWIAKDGLLVDIARRRPTTPQELGQLRGTERLDAGVATGLLACVAGAAGEAAIHPGDPVT